MLTKELLCYLISKDKIYPRFIDPEENENLDIASELLTVFSQSIGNNRENLEENISHIFESFKGNFKVAKGLEKLLFDRTEFDSTPKEDLIKLREEVFNLSSRLLSEKVDIYASGLKNNHIQNLGFYQNKISEIIKESLDGLSHRLYADLPPYQKVLQFRNISSFKLIHRYNCALVQGLLLRSERITISLTGSDTSRLRQILKYLRFNKLLAKIIYSQKKDKLLVLEIDGPLSMFLNTQKYGFNLAKFFPAILLHSNWELMANIRIKKNKTHILKLNQDCGIKSHYKQFLAYVPDEIKLLSEKIKEKIPNWKLNPSAEYLQLGGESICFPDFLLEHTSSKKVYLELFHKWHFKPLLKRLEQVEKIEGIILLIGIDKILLNKDEIIHKTNTSEYFSKFGFFFKEFPSVSKITDLLERLIKTKIK